MILVTGATGLNGMAIVREFARQRHQVRALVRDLDRASAAGLGGLAGVELAEGDMRRAETLRHGNRARVRAAEASSEGAGSRS
ncbi:NmrA family NAD(P)-binding protein [Mesorhizobium sp. LNHC229A00]|uniref:NmrA family NAD(P)-binding protein n=1 Tax=Mesorhizobium sp. LNHC229A00 TaxID=1287240 RepID=UPI0018DD1872|nr:NmrA family NAD(P)-binding protein [Mesorhizobium sp. LNHC229A00]